MNTFDNFIFNFLVIIYFQRTVKPDKDGKYPMLNSIPDTNFTCGGRAAGYYGDPHPKAGCQVYHMCSNGGRHFAYLCPNHTLFHQDRLVCDYWYRVNCTDMERRYVVNEKLFSYPLTSKHPKKINETTRIKLKNSPKKKLSQACPGCLEYFLSNKEVCTPCVSPR